MRTSTSSDGWSLPPSMTPTTVTWRPRAGTWPRRAGRRRLVERAGLDALDAVHPEELVRVLDLPGPGHRHLLRADDLLHHGVRERELSEAHEVRRRGLVGGVEARRLVDRRVVEPVRVEPGRGGALVRVHRPEGPERQGARVVVRRLHQHDLHGLVLGQLQAVRHRGHFTVLREVLGVQRLHLRVEADRGPDSPRASGFASSTTRAVTTLVMLAIDRGFVSPLVRRLSGNRWPAPRWRRSPGTAGPAGSRSERSTSSWWRSPGRTARPRRPPGTRRRAGAPRRRRSSRAAGRRSGGCGRHGAREPRVPGGPGVPAVSGPRADRAGRRRRRPVVTAVAVAARPPCDEHVKHPRSGPRRARTAPSVLDMHHGTTPGAAHGDRSTAPPTATATATATAVDRVTDRRPGDGAPAGDRPVRSTRYLPAEADRVLWGTAPERRRPPRRHPRVRRRPDDRHR